MVTAVPLVPEAMQPPNPSGIVVGGLQVLVAVVPALHPPNPSGIVVGGLQVLVVVVPALHPPNPSGIVVGGLQVLVAVVPALHPPNPSGIVVGGLQVLVVVPGGTQAPFNMKLGAVQGTVVPPPQAAGEAAQRTAHPSSPGLVEHSAIVRVMHELPL